MSGLGWRADTLVALDRQQQRFVLFAPDGTAGRSVRLTPVGDAISTISVGLLADGRVLGYPRRGHGYSDPDTPRMLLIAYRADGEATDTLARLDGHGGSGCMMFAEKKLRACFIRPVMSDDVYALDPDGRNLTVVMRPLAADRKDVTAGVYRVNLKGDTVMRSTLRSTPVPVPRAWRDSVTGEFRARWQRMGEHMRIDGRMIERMVTEGLAIPEYYPLVRAIVVAQGGNTWLRLWQDASEARWLVLDARGDLRARVSGPAAATLLAIRDDDAWGVEHDALDVPYVVRYRVAR